MMGSLVPNAGLRRGLTLRGLRAEPRPGEAKPDLVALGPGNRKNDEVQFVWGNDGQICMSIYIYTCVRFYSCSYLYLCLFL